VMRNAFVCPDSAGLHRQDRSWEGVRALNHPRLFPVPRETGLRISLPSRNRAADFDDSVGCCRGDNSLCGSMTQFMRLNDSLSAIRLHALCGSITQFMRLNDSLSVIQLHGLCSSMAVCSDVWPEKSRKSQNLQGSDISRTVKEQRTPA
jgi:hypothetical protein